MEEVLTEPYGKSFAVNTMRHTKGVCKKLVLEADEMGAGNPIACDDGIAEGITRVKNAAASLDCRILHCSERLFDCCPCAGQLVLRLILHKI